MEAMEPARWIYCETNSLRQLRSTLQDPARHGEMRAYQAAQRTCELSCTLMSAMEECLTNPNKRIEPHLIPYIPSLWGETGGHLLYEACKRLQTLRSALDHLEKAGTPVAVGICRTVAHAACHICGKLAVAYAEQVRLALATQGKEPLSFLDSIGHAEAEAVKLLTHFSKDCPETASVLCHVGHQKVAALAQLAQVLGCIYETFHNEDVQEEVTHGEWDVRDNRFRFHVQEVMSTIWTSVEEVVAGLVQLLSHPDLGVSNEALTVLLGIRFLIALPIFEQNSGSGLRSLWKDLLVGRLENQFENHATFQALGFKPTSTDLERFKHQAQLLGNAGVTSALPPSVTVQGSCEEESNLLQRQEPESRSEDGTVQQVPSAGSRAPCSEFAKELCKEASMMQLRLDHLSLCFGAAVLDHGQVNSLVNTEKH
eukprot:s2142_g13.t1